MRVGKTQSAFIKNISWLIAYRFHCGYAKKFMKPIKKSTFSEILVYEHMKKLVSDIMDEYPEAYKGFRKLTNEADLSVPPPIQMYNFTTNVKRKAKKGIWDENSESNDKVECLYVGHYEVLKHIDFPFSD